MNLIIGTIRLLVLIQLVSKIKSLPEQEQQKQPNGIISSSMRRRLLLSAGSTPVLIYKNSQPWAPLSQAKAFAVKTQPLVLKGGEIDENNDLKSHPSLDDFEGSGEEPEYNENSEREGISDLHESLRQPLKRLSNRQLSVLLKQIRGQRRRQQQTDNTEAEDIQSEQSRKSMLTELHSLLRSDSNNQRLRRPKLLTNINIIPNEWNIYPPKRLNNEDENNKLIEEENKNKTEEIEENINDKNTIDNASVDNITRSENNTEELNKLENEATESISTESIPTETTTESSTTESSTTESTTEITTSESTTTEHSSAELTSTEGPIPKDGLNEKDMADNAEFKRTTEPTKTTTTTNTKSTNILDTSTVNSMHSAEIGPLIENEDKIKQEDKNQKNIASSNSMHSAEIAPLQNVDKTKQEEINESKQQKSIINKEKQPQTNKATFETKKSKNKDEQRIIRLKAHWRVVEQKIANEMNAAVKNSSKLIAEAEKQLIKGGNKRNNSILHASKTFNPTSETTNDEDKKPETQLEDFKTAQFAALSTQLKQIRHRYEALKRQYLAKLKWLKSKKEGRNKNEKGGKKKVAGLPTFLDGADINLDSVGMRKNKTTNENDSKGEKEETDENKYSNLPNNTKIENQKIETELEELKQEEDLTKKISSGFNEELIKDTTNNEEELITSSTVFVPENDQTTTTTTSTTLKKKKKTSKQKKKGKSKPSLKSTLAELAEELNKLDEKLFGDVVVENNSTIKDETDINIKNTPKTQIKIPKTKNLVKKKKIKNTKQQQQLKKSSRVNSSPDLLPASSSLRLPIKTVNDSKTTNVDNKQNRNEILSSQQQPKPIPSVPKRILTTDWNPRALLSDDIYADIKESSNQVQPVPIKLNKDVNGGNRGISNQFDLLPSTEQSSQHQPLFDPTRKTLKKTTKHHHNNTIKTQHQKHHNVSSVNQTQNNQQKQNTMFYQLDKAQVTNVLPKKNQISSDNSDIKLKGVSQVQVKASPEQKEENEANNNQNETDEITEKELQLKLQKEQKIKKIQEKKKNNKKKKNKNKKNKKGEKIEEEFEDLVNLEEFARIDEQTICDAIACDFETGTLCEWEASIDELHPSDPRYKRYLMARRQHIMDRRMRKMAKRSRRDVEHVEEDEEKNEEKIEKNKKKKQNKKNKRKKNKNKKILKDEAENKNNQEKNQTVIFRTWHNWVGQYKNRLTGIAKSEFFSTRNQRFAASYLRPGQKSTLTGRVLSGEIAKIQFWVWEATRDLQLRVCCDDIVDEQCVYQTDKGVKRGSRRWIEQTATCPQGTKKIIFECRNLGLFQGACGLDNIQLLNNYCPSITPTSITK